jgi:phage RecT family recombinase
VNDLIVPSGAKVVLGLDGTDGEWHAARKLGLGGSDIPTLLGMNKHTSPLELYYAKRGELPDMPRSAELEEAAEWGHELEDVVARRWARQFGASVTRGPGTLQHPEAPWMIGNVDRLFAAPRQDGGLDRGVLEVKTRSEYQLRAWQDEAPDGPALQAHWYLAVTGYQVAYVAALIGGNKLRWHRIDRDEDLLADLIEAAAEFWLRVEDGNPPPVDGTPATKNLLNHLYRVYPDKTVDLEGAQVTPLLAARQEAQADLASAEKRIDDAENRLRALIGDAEMATVDARPVATWRANGTFASKRFAEAHPELAETYRTKTCTPPSARECCASRSSTVTDLKDRVKQARAENGNGGGEVEQAHPLTRVKDLLDHMAPEIAKAVPAHMTAERMARIAYTQVRKSPELALCTADSLAGAILTCAQLGLEPGPTGEAYIIPRKNKAGVWEASFEFGYKGMATLFWQHPLAMYLDTQTVYENDVFDYELGLNAFLKHKPAKGKRGEETGEWYAVAKLVTGGYRFVVLDRREVERRRHRGSSPYSPAWKNDYNAMAEKSCVRAIFDLLPKSPELARALAQDGRIRTDLAADALDMEPAYEDAVEGEVVEDEREQGPAPDLSGADAPPTGVNEGADPDGGRS